MHKSYCYPLAGKPICMIISRVSVPIQEMTLVDGTSAGKCEKANARSLTPTQPLKKTRLRSRGFGMTLYEEDALPVTLRDDWLQKHFLVRTP